MKEIFAILGRFVIRLDIVQLLQFPFSINLRGTIKNVIITSLEQGYKVTHSHSTQIGNSSRNKFGSA